VGEALTVGTPANHETVTIAALGASSPTGASVEVKPALAKVHVSREFVVAQGTGLDLAAPLRFMHAANLPFSARGTGITFQPATAFAHASNEPVQPLGTGLTLDRPLSSDHAIDAVVRDATVTTAGYQGSPAPQQWFGGPALSPAAGTMVLRDSAGLVVDSLNYGLLVDPWASEGYQAKSGAGENGCRVQTPGPVRGFGGAGGAPSAAPATLPHRSAARFPDGQDTDSNCTDFVVQPGTTLSAASPAGATNLKVASVADFAAGQTIQIDTAASSETATIATVGTPGATTTAAATSAGATVIPVATAFGFSANQSITIDSGANQETIVIASTTGGRAGATITIASPLARAHAEGAQVSGSGITLTKALSQAHATGSPLVSGAPTPGAPNQYHGASRPR
jgi:hypothetical protein